MKSAKWFVLLFIACYSLVVTQLAVAASVNDYAQTPPIINQRQTPLVMLGMSADNQLFHKAYSDYSDIDGDGILDTTYQDEFDYYGYFESNWCYKHDGVRFIPGNKTATGDNGHNCGPNSAPWSGNFLNWATMTRMDIIRKVLYGGKRSTDTSASTILERAYLPSDVHAFAKVYQGADIGNFTPYTSDKLTNSTLTLCNVSSSHPYTGTSAPQLRLAQGDWRRWSVNELTQCQWDSGSNTPDAASQLNNGSEHIVRVEACVSGKDAGTSSSCRTYSGGAKPAGLLQQYGEEGDLKFGLITGSYDNYVSGGILRKNIGLFGSNTDPNDDEIDLSTGVFRGINGIIKSLDSIRIIGWDGANYRNNSKCDEPGIAIPDFKSGAIYTCRDWGNPIGEIYLEALRYLSAASAATPEFDGDDTPYVPALGKAAWPDGVNVFHPMNSDNRCANCSIVMISSGVNSFDGDELASASGIGGMTGASSVNAATKNVGELEFATFSGTYLTGGGTDLLCSPKYLSALSEASGICPEAPGLEGTYSIAGLARYARVNDLRSDLEDSQTVGTYGVELSENLPSFDIKVGAGSVRFLPACESNSTGTASVTDPGWMPCSLFDVEIISQVWKDGIVGGTLVGGTLAFHWEDSSWGNDYDLDGTQIINFCVGAACSNSDTRVNATYDDTAVGDTEIRITTAVAFAQAGSALRFGYVVTGTNGSDGAPSGEQWLLRPGSQNGNYLGQLPDIPIPTASGHEYYPEARIFSAGSDPATLLEKPLWLAAKHGGFNDLNGDGTPMYFTESTPLSEKRNDTREWDRVNNRTGEVGADGIPDSYYLASNPSLLLSQMQRIFESLVARTSAGSSAAVVANSSTGSGAIYQALYQPKATGEGREVSWAGRLHAIFIDSAGLTREDSNGNAALDAQDKIVTLDYIPSLDETRLQRYAPDGSPEGDSLPIGKLKSIWNAEGRLAAISTPEVQRAYATVSDTGRFILTALDLNGDSEIDQQDTVAFTPDVLSTAFPNFHRYLGLSDTQNTSEPNLASQLVAFIRGDETANAAFRNRTIDINGDGIAEPWRLGDIIHSSPKVVASPSAAYDVTNDDETYQAFVDKYRNRRQVVYVGANDGMLHAFNAGFWDPVNKAFNKQSVGGLEAAHPLGQELWAYVPMNLLPHLQWLKDPDYPHVYFMDGPPTVFDVNAFPEDATHPKGWGTILVVGMRLGGAPIDVDLDGDTATAPTAFTSAYVVMDITDPESPPVLLGEVTLPDLGLTVPEPVLVKKRIADSVGSFVGIDPGNNQWHLILGSGPTGPSALSQGESDRPARYYALDLRKLIANSRSATQQTSYLLDLGGANGSRVLDSLSNGWVGGAVEADWDNDMIDDNLYFGLVSGPQATPSGQLMRQLINDTQGAYSGLATGALSTFLNPGRPVQARPAVGVDSRGERWVLFGTGRQMVTADVGLDQQQYFYGVKEPRDSTGSYTNATVSPASLIDTTDIGVFESGAVKDLSSGTTANLQIAGVDVVNYSGLETEMVKHPGWRLTLRDPADAPAGRVLNQATFNPGARDQFSFISYVPNGDSCIALGTSYLYELSLTTGTSTPDAPLDTTSAYTVDGKELSLSNIKVGNGLVFGTTYHQSADGGTQVIIGDETGALGGVPIMLAPVDSGRQSWREIDLTSF